MSNRVKPQSAAFLAVLSIVGVLLMILGASFAKAQPFWMNVVTALGAAIVGSALSIFIGWIYEPSPVNEIFRQLSVANNFSLITDDEKVRPRRLKYHGYLLSHALGKPQWKYRVFDFTLDHRPGYLHARVDVWVPTESNEDKKYPNREHPRHSMIGGGDGTEPVGHQVYVYNGYLCEPYHLILIGRLAPEYGTEPDVIHIFPFGLKVQSGVMCGMAFLETSDNKHVVTPSILSRVRLTSETKYGPVVSAAEQAKLLTTWQKQFMSDFRINLPTDFHFEEVAGAADGPDSTEE